MIIINRTKPMTLTARTKQELLRKITQGYHMTYSGYTGRMNGRPSRGIDGYLSQDGKKIMAFNLQKFRRKAKTVFKRKRVDGKLQMVKQDKKEAVRDTYWEAKVYYFNLASLASFKQNSRNFIAEIKL